ncbi:hypothetical protein XENOCAPTIV_013198 [Xenoophorus captivus]|uniref:Secreted protein n=1 Tax=Xenoophorus captivus TaxID=1517983 RepID=A0ABV0RQB2_9TELE
MSRWFRLLPPCCEWRYCGNARKKLWKTVLFVWFKVQLSGLIHHCEALTAFQFHSRNSLPSFYLVSMEICFPWRFCHSQYGGRVDVALYAAMPAGRLPFWVCGSGGTIQPSRENV